MFNLIKNEIFKVFKKNSTIIFMLIMLIYSGLIIYMYNRDNFFVTETKYEMTMSDEEINTKIDALDKNNDNYYYDLIDLLVEQKQNELFQSANNKSWKEDFIVNKYTTVLYDYYFNKYFEGNKKVNKEKLETLEYFENILKNNLEFDYVKYYINDLEQTIKDISSDDNETETYYLNKELELYKYRLDNLVSFDNSYLDMAITNQKESYQQLQYFSTLNKLTEEDKLHIKYIEGDIVKNEYILNNKVDLDDTKSVRSLLITFGDNYILFIFLFVIMVAGTIFSNEFSKGTIKNLLITPYSRTKILFSKFITMFLSLPFITIVLLLFNIVIGGLVFGLSSLSIPVMEFNHTTELLVQYNVFSYIGLVLLSITPQILLLMTLAFLLSIIYPSASLAISIPFAGLIASNIINMLAITYKVKFLRYFVTLNWDFQQYIFGRSPFEMYYEYTSLTFSIVICTIYFAVMLGFALLLFKNKDIKNS